MSLFEDVMQLAVQMPMDERERLGRALGLKLEATPASASANRGLPLMNRNADPSKTDPVAWRKAETGHAVLNTAFQGASGATGAAAIAGMWSEFADEWENEGDDIAAPLALDLPKGSPVLVHTDICVALALGIPEAVQFWENPPVETRLATATYLTLLDAAEDDSQLAALRAFVQPFAVLSLGPMASSKSVELMMSYNLQTGLSPLDALIAATALAHEIPIVTCNPAPFEGIAGLQVARPF
jgi:predicted nucleic acid-binding protein